MPGEARLPKKLGSIAVRSSHCVSHVAAAVLEVQPVTTHIFNIVCKARGSGAVAPVSSLRCCHQTCCLAFVVMINGA